MRNIIIIEKKKNVFHFVRGIDYRVYRIDTMMLIASVSEPVRAAAINVWRMTDIKHAASLDAEYRDLV